MKNKYTKIPKKYRVTKSNPAIWRIISLVHHRFLFGRFKYPLWLLRPICWIKGHKNRVLYPYGAKVKQCQRCAKEFYRKRTNETLSYISGIVGELYGVRFIQTKNSHKKETKK